MTTALSENDAAEEAIAAQIRSIEADLRTLPAEVQQKFGPTIEIARGQRDVHTLAIVAREVGDLTTQQMGQTVVGGAVAVGAMAEIGAAVGNSQNQVGGGDHLPLVALFTPDVGHGLGAVGEGYSKSRGVSESVNLPKLG